jgi:hypothetical protein
MSELEFLVNYGQGGFLGRFRSGEDYRRGDLVVVQSGRGVELGTILERAVSDTVDLSGVVLRMAGPDDRAAAHRCRERALPILTDAQTAADCYGLPLLFLDAEVLLDGSQAILQAVHWADCDATSVFAELSTRHGLRVTVADLTTTVGPAAGGCPTCGAEKSGCDSCGTGGGCSTGSCAKGSVKSADELTAYFAGLRQQMEAASARVSLQ